MSLFDTINYHIVPPVFLVFFTVATQLLAYVGNPTKPFELSFIFGSVFSWKLIASMLAWAILWLKVPSKKFEGPTTSFGLTPIYQANGELYYFASLLAFGVVAALNPDICVAIYQHHGETLGGLNILALTLCLFLLVRAKQDKNPRDPYLRQSQYPILHEFYRGMELHPRLLGVDVKQLTNCRVGMMMWQLLTLTYFLAGCKLHGFDPGHLVNVLLQTVYIYKFFRWETGYFNTLDITLDRAGYYICWGCLVWIPSFYTFHSYYFVHHRPHASALFAMAVFVLGMAAIYYNYDVDRQKELFRTADGREIKIWGKKAEGVKATYTTAAGLRKQTQLMVSGWWGMARKINYTFELTAAFLWSFPAGFYYGVWPFLYFLFLLTLLVHRVYRDEAKCQDKYGRAWNEYCKRVPYRLIPYVF